MTRVSGVSCPFSICAIRQTGECEGNCDEIAEDRAADRFHLDESEPRGWDLARENDEDYWRSA